MIQYNGSRFAFFQCLKPGLGQPRTPQPLAIPFEYVSTISSLPSCLPSQKQLLGAIPGSSGLNIKAMGARSKGGCISCKARHVKCDESQPTCQRCQKARIACKGYTPRYEFIDEKARVERAVAIASSQQDNFSALQSSAQVLYHTSQVPQQSQISLSAMKMHLTAFKDTICLSYLVKKLREDRAGSAKSIWIEETSRGSHNALNALATMVFGQAHRSRDTIMEARKSYGKALVDVRFALADASRYQTFDTLASVSALCMYEVSHL